MIDRSSVREFSRLLFNSQGEVDLFELHEKYRLAPSTVIRLVRIFSRLGIIKKVGTTSVILVPGGRAALWRRRFKLMYSGNRSWVDIREPDILPGEPYLPDLGRLDKEFFLRSFSPSEMGKNGR